VQIKGSKYTIFGTHKFSSNINARLQDNLSRHAAEGETSITLISGLRHNTKDMLAQTKRQSEADGIQKLCPLQNQITTPDNRPEIMLDDLSKHAVRGRQSTNPDGRSSLPTLRDSMKELLELIQGRGQY
jgi:hypothetical protein